MSLIPRKVDEDRDKNGGLPLRSRYSRNVPLTQPGNPPLPLDESAAAVVHGRGEQHEQDEPRIPPAVEEVRKEGQVELPPPLRRDVVRSQDDGEEVDKEDVGREDHRIACVDPGRLPSADRGSGESAWSALSRVDSKLPRHATPIPWRNGGQAKGAGNPFVLPFHCLAIA